MAKVRDYQKEYEQRKQRIEDVTRVTVIVPNPLYEDFIAKLELESINKSAKIKELITDYTYGKVDNN